LSHRIAVGGGAFSRGVKPPEIDIYYGIERPGT
jgi:hypothetical protein